MVACSASTDPDEGGLFGGVRGLSTGAYEKRAAEREARLARLHEIERELDADKAALETEEANKQKTIATIKQDLAALELESQRLSQDVARLEKERGASDASVAELRSRLGLLQQEFNEVKSVAAEDAAQRKALRLKAATLTQEYKDVLDLYLQLEQ